MAFFQPNLVNNHSVVLELFPNLNPQCKLRFPFSAARWKSLKKCYWITLALFQLLFLGLAWQPRNAARQTSIPLHNLIDQLESVKTNHIFLNGSLSLTFQFFKAITHADSFKKTVLLHFLFLPFTIKTVIYTRDTRPFGAMWEACGWQQSIPVFRLVSVCMALPNSPQTD